MPLRQRLERYFEFEALGTNWRTELLAGVTTFVTMAYIIFVNPSILQDAGMPFAAVIAATCLSRPPSAACSWADSRATRSPWRRAWA